MTGPTSRLLCMLLSCLGMMTRGSFALQTPRFLGIGGGASKIQSLPVDLAADLTNCKQLLDFREPTTNVRVVLIGAMHYNPWSIQLTSDVVQKLGDEGQLASVVIESCLGRYSAPPPNEIFAPLLTSEMKTSSDLAMQVYQRPVVLGDQLINITTTKLKQSFQDTLTDLGDPWQGGWERLALNITSSWKEAAAPPTTHTTTNYLGPSNFLDPQLLLAAPVSFIKYPLSYLLKAPIQTILVLSLLILTDTAGTMTSPEDLGLLDYLGSISFAGLETVFFGRIILDVILAQRNRFLADSILAQCRLYSSNNKNWWSGGGSRGNNNDDIVYIPESVDDTSSNALESPTVVAVLGMAHCNGVKKLLLREQE